MATGDGYRAGYSATIYRTEEVPPDPDAEPQHMRITRNADGDVIKTEQMVDGQWVVIQTIEYVDPS